MNQDQPITIHIGALGELPAEARLVLLLGNRGCDHLREIRRMAEFRGRAAFIIESVAELQPRWFAHAGAVGLVLGSTSLQALQDAVVTRLREIETIRAQGMLEGVAR